LPVCRNLPRHGPGITALPETSGNPAPFPAPTDGPPGSDRHGGRVRPRAHALRHRRAIAKLPEADYAIETWPEGALGTEIALGYLFSLYGFRATAPSPRRKPA
jgi:hypothetical protein